MNDQIPLYTLDPLNDPRWDRLVATHGDASVFHRSGWLKALARTYGYRPVVVTSAPPGSPLCDGAVFCEVRSVLTGSRLVSVPFSDNSQPLLGEAEDLHGLVDWVKTSTSRAKWRYVEIRALSLRPEWRESLRESQSFWLHMLSLAPPIETLYGSLHRDCVRRRIRHAEHEHLEYERGVSAKLIGEFYDLLVTTRKRHGLLPQPQLWFQNLVKEMSPDAEIRVVRWGGSPIAAIFALRHRDRVVYKYGCSDHQFHHLGGMPLLFWRLIEESKAEGASEIDLGRTDFENASLAQFKDRLGAERRTITYLRYSERTRTKPVHLHEDSVAAKILSKLPRVLSSGLGSVVYRHIG